MEEVREFFRNHRVGALSTISSEGYPESAVLHYSNNDNPLAFYFSTERSSRKIHNIRLNSKASFVIGFSEEEFITVQMNGIVKELGDEELTEAKKIHYKKHPDSKQYENDPETVFISFTPSWIKISDYKVSPANIKEINLQS
ncbi:MAG: pyridoxamine 5'-phosphate oxidase family protein [Candidatus Levybacteria bacterium]|nr:pyridoxamine 5'-phosphate oxidase family protein [Candidatus Levybacteria bacterium]